MTEEAKRIADALRRCGSAGISICNKEHPIIIDGCDGCVCAEGVADGSPRTCFETWIKAADLLESLSVEYDEYRRATEKLCKTFGEVRKELESDLEATLKELEAAKRDIGVSCMCEVCKHDTGRSPECEPCVFEWAGMRKKNGGNDNGLIITPKGG